MKTLAVVVQGAAKFGGSYVWLERMAEVMPARGWRVVTLATPDAGVRNAVLEAVACERVALSSGGGTPTGRRRSIARAIRRLEPDVVIPLMTGDLFPAVVAIPESIRPRVVYGAHEIAAPLLADVFRWRSVVTGAVGVSRAICAILEEILAFPRDRLDRIPYGVPSRLAESRGPDRKGVLRIGYAGRFDDDKRIRDVKPFADALDETGLDWALDLVGDGDRLGELSDSLRMFVERGKVTFHGFQPREELYRRFYPGWDAFVLFSPSEGFPIAVTEAMLHGVVPIVSDYRGRTAEGFVEDERNALVFPVGSPARAAELAARLALDQPLWTRLSDEARRSVERECSLSVMGDRWARTLDRATEAPPPLGPFPRISFTPSGRLDRWLGPVLGDRIRSVRSAISRAREPAWPYSLFEDRSLIDEIETQIQTMVESGDGKGVAWPD